MRTGYDPGYTGPIGSADSGGKMARRAEERGCENLWRMERLSHPVDPQSPYPVTPHGVLAHQWPGTPLPARDDPEPLINCPHGVS